MILSEFAGAAHSLNGSIIFNPVRRGFLVYPCRRTAFDLFIDRMLQWNIEEAANGIHAAMTMDPKTRSENYGKLSTYGPLACSFRCGLDLR